MSEPWQFIIAYIASVMAILAVVHYVIKEAVLAALREHDKDEYEGE